MTPFELAAPRSPLFLLAALLAYTACEPVSTASSDPETFVDLREHWDFSDPAASEARFRELLAAAEASGDVSYRAQLLTQLARAQGLQQRSDDAHRTLDRAEALLGEKTTIARIRVELERGRAHNGIPGATDPEVDARKQRARPFFLRAYELARDSGQDALALDAAHMMGIVEPPDEALRWSDEAIALAEQAEDPRARGWLGPLYNNTGWTYHDRGEYERALELFEKGVEFRRSAGEGPELRIARWTVARTLRSLDRPEEALALQRELLAEWEAAGDTGPYVLEEIAECLLELGRTDEARPFFARAHAELAKDEWLVKNEPDRLRRLDELGSEEN